MTSPSICLSRHALGAHRRLYDAKVAEVKATDEVSAQQAHITAAHILMEEAQRQRSDIVAQVMAAAQKGQFLVDWGEHHAATNKALSVSNSESNNDGNDGSGDGSSGHSKNSERIDNPASTGNSASNSTSDGTSNSSEENPHTGPASPHAPSLSGEKEAHTDFPEQHWLPVSTIVDHVHQLLAPFNIRIPVLVRDSAAALNPAWVQQGTVISGATANGKIYLFRDGLPDQASVTRTLFHELLHAGLQKFLSPRQYTQALNKLYASDPWIREQAKAWLTSADGIKLAETATPAYARARGVDEALAYLAEGMNAELAIARPTSRYRQTLQAVLAWVARLADSLGFHAAAQQWRSTQSQTDARQLISDTFNRFRHDETANTDDNARPAHHGQVQFSREDGVVGLMANRPNVIAIHYMGEIKMADYNAAKQGDKKIADALVKESFRVKFPEKIRLALRGKNAIIQPVTSKTSKNVLPLAFAKNISERLHVERGEKIYQSSASGRRGMEGVERLFMRPQFAGDVEAGRNYFLVDDTVSQGGVLAALTKYIESKGGIVIGYATLQGKGPSEKLALDKRTLQEVREKHGNLEEKFASLTGHSFADLTHSEANFINTKKHIADFQQRVRAGDTRFNRQTLIRHLLAEEKQPSNQDKDKHIPSQAKSTPFADTARFAGHTAQTAHTAHSRSRLDSTTADHSASVAQPSSQWLGINDLNAQLQKLIKPFKTHIPIVISDSAAALNPAWVQQGTVISGATANGKIYLFRDGLPDQASVTRTLFHELLHAGLQKFLSPRQYTQALNKLYASDPWIREQAKAWLTSADGIKLAETATPAYARARGVDEALAYLAESMNAELAIARPTSRYRQTLQAVLAWVARLADSLGFHAAAQQWRSTKSQTDARQLISDTFQRLRDGEEADADYAGHHQQAQFSRQDKDLPFLHYEPDDPRIGVPATWDVNRFSPVVERDVFGNENMYRSIYDHQINYLRELEKLLPSGETGISPSRNYASKYQGYLIRLTLKPGTMERLMAIAGRGKNMIKDHPDILPHIPLLKDNWTQSSVQVKLEGTNNPYVNNRHGVINTLLGKGKNGEDSEGLKIINEKGVILKIEIISYKPGFDKKIFDSSDKIHF